MSQTKPQQKGEPLSEVRNCFRCGKEIHFLEYISIMGDKQHHRFKSYELSKLVKFWEEFHNEEVDVYCRRCHFYYEYSTCAQCGRYRYTKEIIVHYDEGDPARFPSCRVCVNETFGIDFDNYNEDQKEIVLRRKTHD